MKRRSRLLPGPAAVAFAALAASAAVFRISTYDVWWHLAAGRWIFEHGRVPRSDPFSYTAPGAPWVDHEWLFQCLVFGIERLAGAPGLVLAKAALVAAAAAVVYRFVRRESGLPAPAAALLLVPFLLAGRERFVVRPELFTLLFAALLLTSILARRDRAPGRRELLWIPLLFVLWANLHAGVIVGFVLLAAHAVGRWFESRLLRGEEAVGLPVGISFALALAAPLAALVNPFGHRVHLAPFHLTALIERGPFDNLEWRPPGWPEQWLFFVVAAAVIGAAGVAVARSRRRTAFSALLPLLFLLFVSLRYVRNTALFSLLAPILLVRLLDPEGERPWAGRLGALRPTLATALLALLAASFLVSGGGFAPGVGVDPRRLPVAAADFVAAVEPPGRMLNAYAFGGYAAWRLYPGYRIFIDGRNEVFAPLRARLKVAVGDSREWWRLLDELDVGWTLLAYLDQGVEVRDVDAAGRPLGTVRRPFAETYFPRREWALVYWDDTAMVHVRRTPEAAELIARHESAVAPEDPEHLAWLVTTGGADRAAVERELERRAAAGPGRERARRLLAALAGPAPVRP